MPGAKATHGARTSSLMRKIKENAQYSVMDAKWKKAMNMLLTLDPDIFNLLIWLPHVHTFPNGETSSI